MFIALVSLALFYALTPIYLTQQVVPPTEAAYELLLAEHPSMKCACRNEAIRLGSFVEVEVEVNEACDWVREDLERAEDDDEETISACEKKNAMFTYCEEVNAACITANHSLEWALNEFEDYQIASPELIKSRLLLSMATDHFESSLRLGKVINEAPLKLIMMWATANMPKLLRMNGDLANRVKALSVRSRRDFVNGDGSFRVNPDSQAPSWTEFVESCESAISEKCAKDDTCDHSATDRCDAERVGDGNCDEACLSAPCFYDGGDCRGETLGGGTNKEEGGFQLYDAVQFAEDESVSWLDASEFLFYNVSRRRCDQSTSWLETELLPSDKDMVGHTFGGYDHAFPAFPDYKKHTSIPDGFHLRTTNHARLSRSLCSP